MENKTEINKYKLLVKESSLFINDEEKRNFVETTLGWLGKNPTLWTCEKESLLRVFFEMKNLGLTFGDESCYVIPYNIQGKTVAQFQMSYKGYISLALRTNKVQTINASDVREGELINNDRLTGELTFNWEQDINKRNKLAVIGYVAFIEFSPPSFFKKTFFMSKEQLESHFNTYSTAYKSFKQYKNSKSVFGTSYEQMCLKTVLKLLISKYALTSLGDENLKRVAKIDSSTIDKQGNPLYVDNLSVIELAKESLENDNKFKLIENGKEIYFDTEEEMKSHLENYPNNKPHRINKHSSNALLNDVMNKFGGDNRS